MIPTIRSIEEAEQFFLSNSSGYCYITNGTVGKEVNCYPDAVDFFNSL